MFVQCGLLRPMAADVMAGEAVEDLLLSRARVSVGQSPACSLGGCSTGGLCMGASRDMAQSRASRG